MTFSPDLFLGTLDTGMGPKTPLSWLPCLLEGTEVHWHPGQRSCDSLLPSPEQRAIFEQQPPSGLVISRMKQEGLAQYLPQPSKPCYFQGEFVSRVQRIPERWLGWGGQGVRFEPRWKEGSPGKQGLLFWGLGCMCHISWAGDSDRNYCTWERQVSLVSWRS